MQIVVSAKVGARFFPSAPYFVEEEEIEIRLIHS
jgi:hypothetical protein